MAPSTAMDSVRPSIDAKLNRAFEHMDELEAAVEAFSRMRPVTVEQLLQGPLADVMTHAGQLALLRRLAGSPVPPENFIRAAIDGRNLGASQPAPVAPDPGWSPDLPPPAPGKNVPKDW